MDMPSVSFAFNETYPKIGTNMYLDCISSTNLLVKNKYVWYKDNNKITLPIDEINNSLNLTNVQQNDAANYSCISNYFITKTHTLKKT